MFAFICLIWIGAASASPQNTKASIMSTDGNPVENALKGLKSLIDPKVLLNGLVGSAMILHGGQFKNSMQFMHALSGSMPALTKNIDDLVTTFVDTRAALKKEMPELIKAKDQLLSMKTKALKLKKDMTSLEKSLASKSISKVEFENKWKTCSADLTALSTQMKKIQSSESAFAQIVQAVNPAHLKQTFTSVYSSMVVGLAAVQNPVVGSINQGVNMGTILEDGVNKALVTYKVDNLQTRTWGKECVSIVTKGLGIAVAHQFTAVAPVISACVLGSQIVTGALDKLLNSVSKDLPEGFKAKSLGMIQTGLIAFGCAAQLGSTALPAPMKALLGPLLAFEKFLESKKMK